MANTKSSKKRIKIQERNRRRNRSYKSKIRTLTKSLIKIVESYKITKSKDEQEKATKIFSEITSLLDKGTKCNVFHKNAAARQKSRLALYMYCQF